MKRGFFIPLALSLYTLGSMVGAERPSTEPIITDNSPASFAITWRNDTGVRSKFGPSLEGLRWEYRGTTKLGVALKFSGAYIPSFNDIKVGRFASSRCSGPLAQWQFTVRDSLTKGVEHFAREGGVSKEPVSDGLLPGFRTVAFSVTPDRQGSGWTASLKWSN